MGISTRFRNREPRAKANNQREMGDRDDQHCQNEITGFQNTPLLHLKSLIT